jgi:hypothetical protein
VSLVSLTENGERRATDSSRNIDTHQLRWEFFTTSSKHDGRCRWQWKLLKGQRVAQMSDCTYETFLQCLDDAKEHGFDTDEDIHLADPVTTRPAT